MNFSQTPAPYESDLDYIEEELEWVETRLRRIATSQKLEERESSELQPWREEQEPASRLETRIESLRDEEEELRGQIDRRIEVTRGSDVELALDDICDLYDLDDFERNVLLLAAAPVFSQRFSALYGDASSAGFRMSELTVELAFTFHELSFRDRIDGRSAFASDAPLVANDLVALELYDRLQNPEDLLTANLHITTRTFQFLVGQEDLMEGFMEFSSLEEPMASLDQVVLDPDDKRRILSVIESHDAYLEARTDWGFDEIIEYGRGMLMLFHGDPGTGKTMMAHAVADHLDKRVLNVDIPTFTEHHEAERFLPALFREARLQDALLFFDECEAIFGSRRMGNALMTLLLTEIERFEGVAVLATNMPEQLDDALHRRIMVKVHFPEPDKIAREEIWREHLPKEAPLADDVDLGLLAERYETTGGYIKNAVLMSVAEAVHTGGADAEIEMQHLERAVQDQLEMPTDDETNLLRPSVELDDVVLPEFVRETVDEMVEAVRNRRVVFEQWGIGERLSHGKGISALFYGEPGTGKTMCAEAIANALNRPLLAASLPSVKSKWVGETEQNLQSLFEQSRSRRAVLFIDEADALLMERGEGRASRHDDSVVNVLLTLIERHQNVVVLATNRPQSLDDALERRLTYTIEFPFPDAELRSRIWENHLPSEAPTGEDVDVVALGERFELSGGLIKQAVFKAAFRAASDEKPISMELLEEAAERQGIGGDETRDVGFFRED